MESVSVAKDIKLNTIPTVIKLNSMGISTQEVSDTLATFFDNTVGKILDKYKVDDSVYNGKKKVNSTSKHFTNRPKVLSALKLIKIK